MPVPLYMEELTRQRLGAVRIVTEKLDVLFKNSALARTSLCCTKLTPQLMRDESIENGLHWALEVLRAEGLAGRGLDIVGEDTPPLQDQPGFTWFYLTRARGEAGTVTLMPQPLIVLQQAIRKGMFDKNEMVTWMLDIPEGAFVQDFATEARYWLAVLQNNNLMPGDCQIVDKRYESGREVCYVADEGGKKLPSEAMR